VIHLSPPQIDVVLRVARRIADETARQKYFDAVADLLRPKAVFGGTLNRRDVARATFEAARRVGYIEVEE
jgi:uncharacterized Zn finger protein